jgi:hypothetical protein
MTFGNMRADGVSDLRVYCSSRFCYRQATINADGFADDMFIVDIDRRFACTVCGAIGAETMLDWPNAMVSLA